MNRIAGRAYAPPSKATPSTLCQKCLKRGHYSYECTSKAQERPYTSRPSRTQQLLNPKLQPKLTSDEPNALLRKEGIADEQLKKINDERGRKRRRLDDGETSDRSASSSSVASVSTISTSASRSPSPPKVRQVSGKKPKREGSSHHKRSGSRSRRSHRRRYSGSPSDNSSSDSERVQRQRSFENKTSRRPPRRQRSTENSSPQHARDRRRSRSPGVDRNRTGGREWSGSPEERRNDVHYRDNEAEGGTGERFSRSERVESGRAQRRQQPPQERSLSPYSKRLALTQAMNMSR